MPSLATAHGGSMLTSPKPSSSSPLKPILSRKTQPQSVLGTRRRDVTDDGEADSEEQSRPSKRQKSVVFDETLNTVKQIGNKTLDEVKSFVRKALENHSKGDDGYYEELKEIFAADRSRRARREADGHDTAQYRELLLYVLALTSHTPLLARCQGLVINVLGCHWLSRDHVFAKAYARFLASFVSAQGSYMSQVLSTIVEKFTESRLPPKTIPGYPPVKRTVVKDRLHFALRYILKLFPACEPLLQGQMGNHYPSSADTSEVHLEYVDNLLRLREYTNLGRDILELVTLKCCELDIEMQLDLQDDSDETVQQIMQDIAATEAQLAEREATSAGGLDSDEEDEEDSDVESIMSDESDLEEIARIAKIRNKIQSMDAILDRLFSLYDRELSSDLSSADASDCFENILADFVNIILIRYKSRHSQFVIFWAAQKSPEFTSRFIGCLLDIIITDSSRTALDKQTAVAFLTGFVARAAKVNGEDVRLVFTCLLDYIEYFRKQYEQSALGPDLTRYPVFYALFQGLLYTFCFRWRDLVMVEEGSFVDPDDMATYRRAELTWVDGLQGRIKACVHSKLNPLKVCAPAIVQEFARLAHALNLIYVYPRLEQNKSISLSAVAHATPSGMFRDTGTFHEERSTPLQADFPFDPYQLPVSKRWLEQEHVYISWDSLPDPADRRQTHGDQDTDDDEEEEEDDDDDEEQNGDLESEAYDS